MYIKNPVDHAIMAHAITNKVWESGIEVCLE